MQIVTSVRTRPGPIERKQRGNVFKKNMTDFMKESSRNTANAITQITTAIESI